MKHSRSVESDWCPEEDLNRAWKYSGLFSCHGYLSLSGVPPISGIEQLCRGSRIVAFGTRRHSSLVTYNKAP